MLLCRAPSGETALWDAPENVHAHGILDHSSVPAAPALRPAIAEAQALARKVADALDYVGVLTMELFATAEGAVFNEMAPRVHNSGHWSIEGALTSQFENHVRARSEEHTSELQSLMRISYAVFCLKKTTNQTE